MSNNVGSINDSRINVKKCASRNGLKLRSANTARSMRCNTAVQDRGRRLNQSQFRSMAEVFFLPSANTWKRASASREPWTKKPFKNSYSRQLRIVNAVVSWSPAGQIDWSKSVFLQDKVTVFEMMMITMNEVNRYKTKVPDYYFFFVFIMFRLSVLLLNSMSKLIQNRCTYKLTNM